MPATINAPERGPSMSAAGGAYEVFTVAGSPVRVARVRQPADRDRHADPPGRQQPSHVD